MCSQQHSIKHWLISDFAESSIQNIIKERKMYVIEKTVLSPGNSKCWDHFSMLTF